MNNPKIYGFCPAGCKWETVHRNEFDASKSAVPIYENEADHTYHLTNKDINLLEENPYYDTTQHFKVYDGTGATVIGNQKWQVEFYATLYVDGIAVGTKKIGSLSDRTKYAHEIDFIIKSIEIGNTNKSVTVHSSLDNSTGTVVSSQTVATENIGVDIFVKNIGYPYTTEDGTTTERVDGCDETRVYAIGFGKGFWGRYYSNLEIDEKFNETEKTVNKITDFSKIDIFTDEQYPTAKLVHQYCQNVTDTKIEEAVGDIDTALDSIIAIQNGLLGGATE